MTGEPADIAIQEIILNNGTRIVWDTLHSGQSRKLNQEAGQIVAMHFTLTGAVLLSATGLESPVSVRASQHTMLYPAGGIFQLENGADEPCQFLQVHVADDFFGQPSNHDGPGLHQLAALVQARQPACLSPENRSVTADMHTVLAHITKCPLTCSLKRLFLEAKVLELLTLQLAQYESRAVGSEPDAPIPDYDKLMETRRLLETHFDNPPTLRELSRLVGLNEFKLKKGFKAAFGDTIHHWALSYRLNQAYQLLQSRQLSISEVAYQVGYQHPAHFTTAFKKKFGVVPSQLIDSQLKLQEV